MCSILHRSIPKSCLGVFQRGGFSQIFTIIQQKFIFWSFIRTQSLLNQRKTHQRAISTSPPGNLRSLRFSDLCIASIQVICQGIIFPGSKRLSRRYAECILHGWSAVQTSLQSPAASYEPSIHGVHITRLKHQYTECWFRSNPFHILSRRANFLLGTASAVAVVQLTADSTLFVRQRIPSSPKIRHCCDICTHCAHRQNSRTVKEIAFRYVTRNLISLWRIRLVNQGHYWTKRKLKKMNFDSSGDYRTFRVIYTP